MAKTNYQNNSAIIAVVAIVAIVLGISLLVPRLSITPTGASVKDECGNDVTDFGETCSTCPSDVPCHEGYSCISNECTKIGLKPKGAQYCGYLTGHYGRDEGIDLALKATDSYQTCVSASSPQSTADKLFDNKQMMSSDYIWMCSDEQGLRTPQYASIKLDKEYIINHIKVLSSFLGFDDANVKEVTISISTDSTDGSNGHWLNVAQGQLRNTWEDSQDIFFDPTSAKWVRLTVNSLWNEPTMMGIAEFKVYQASYICDSDYELNWNK